MAVYKPITTPRQFSDHVRLDTSKPGVEDQHLEFKGKCHYDQPDKDKRLQEQREVARDITQFSNTDGGTVLYGISEKADPNTGVVTADGIVPIADVGRAKDWIVAAISRFVYPATPQPRVSTNHFGVHHVLARYLDNARCATRRRRHRRARAVTSPGACRPRGPLVSCSCQRARRGKT